MADVLTHGEQLSLERARALAERRQAVGCYLGADLIATIDRLVARVERETRRRRKPATPATIPSKR